MAQLVDAYHNVAGQSEVREMIRLRERAQRDEASALAFAERAGIQKGERQKALTIASILKSKGLSISDIIDATGLSIDDILPL